MIIIQGNWNSNTPIGAIALIALIARSAEKFNNLPFLGRQRKVIDRVSVHFSNIQKMWMHMRNLLFLMHIYADYIHICDRENSTDLQFQKIFPDQQGI